MDSANDNMLIKFLKMTYVLNIHLSLSFFVNVVVFVNII